MSTVGEIIQATFREGNLISIGEVPTPAEIEETVPQLNRYIQSLFGNELGEQFRDWYIPTRIFRGSPLRSTSGPAGNRLPVGSSHSWQVPPANVRLVCKTITGMGTPVVYFPQVPNDGARMFFADVGSETPITLDANGRLIEGSPSITGQPAVGPDPGPPEPHQFNGRQWMYRADLGNWIRIDQPIGEDDQVFFPVEFDDLLITGLLMRIARRFGVKVDGEAVARNADMTQKLKVRYKQSEAIPVDREFVRQFPSGLATHMDF